MKWVSPWIHTTDKCNFGCSYCYVAGNEVMEEPVYMALRKMLLSLKAEKMHLRIAGGEPLLVFDKWRTFSEEMLEHPGTTVEVLTNLSFIPEGFKEFAEKERVNISVSVDAGPRYKRLDQKLMDRIEAIKNPYYLMTTVTEENLHNIVDIADYVGRKGFGWAISTDYFWKENPSIDDLVVEMILSMKLLKYHKYDFNKLTFNNAGIHETTGCCAGNEMFSVYCDGNIYPCQTQHNSGKLGNVFDGYKRQKKNKKPACVSCSVNAFCSGWCPLYHKPGSEMCDLIRIVLHEILKGD